MRYLKFTLKALISLGLLAYLVYNAEPKKILEVFGNISASDGIIFLLIAFAFELLAVLLMAFRWQALLRGYRVDVKIGTLYGYYLIGLFFNNFLPSSIGGDVIRIYKVMENLSDRTVGFASVIIERMMGIAATMFLAIFALFFISQQFHSSRLLYFSIALFLFIVLFFFLMTRNRPFKFLLHLFDRFTIFNIGEKFNKLFEAIHFFKKRKRILGYVFLFSISSQISIVLMNFYLARAFSMDIELSYLFMVVPVTFVLTMLPSINGVGFREFGYKELLGRIGISSAAAISLAFMNLLLPMFLSLIGAFLFVVQKRKIKIKELETIETSL